MTSRRIAKNRPLQLSAGQLEARVEEGAVRHIVWAGREAVARIYVGVRAGGWRTVPTDVKSVSVLGHDHDSFRVQICGQNTGFGLDLGWQGLLEGFSAGRLRFSLRARLSGTARFDRIGICLLHRSRLLAGAGLVAHGPRGPERAIVTATVAPQWEIGGVELGVTEPFRRLELETLSGLRIVESFRGSWFELEDERNFGDGFFKIYCPPLREGYPIEAPAGSVFRQSVSLSLTAPAADVTAPQQARRRARPRSRPRVEVELAPGEGSVMPPVGIDGRCLPAGDVGAASSALRLIRPRHVRFEIDLGRPSWPEELRVCSDLARRCGVPLECGLWTEEAVSETLDSFAALARGNNFGIVRIIVHARAPSPPSVALMEVVARTIGRGLPGLPVLAGWAGDLCELNRHRPRYEPWHGVAFATNPGVHLGDDEVAFEGLYGQADGVATLAGLYPGVPVGVTPVTTGPMEEPAAGDLHMADATSAWARTPRDDRRLHTTIGAAWTAGSIEAIVHAGGGPVTYGHRIGSGETPPFAHVLAATAAMQGEALIGAVGWQPEIVRVLGVERQHSYVFIVANLIPDPVDVELSLPPGTRSARRRVLDTQTMLEASSSPMVWSRKTQELGLSRGRARDRLGGHAVGFYEVVRGSGTGHSS